jgi:tetratricopeptide (TPR) repeat protein
MRTTASYDLFPDAPSERAMARARWLVREGRVADAESAYRGVLATHPDLKSCWAEYFELLRAAGRLQDALHLAESAGAHFGNGAFPLALQGAALIELDRYRDALTVLERAVEADPDLALVWHELGVACYRLGDPNRALLALDRAFALEPHTETLKLRGKILRDAGRFAAAEVAFEGAAQAAEHQEQREDAEREIQVTRRYAYWSPRRPDDLNPAERWFAETGTVVLAPAPGPVPPSDEALAKAFVELARDAGWRFGQVVALGPSLPVWGWLAEALGVPLASRDGFDLAAVPLVVAVRPLAPDAGWTALTGIIAEGRRGLVFVLEQPAEAAGEEPTTDVIGVLTDAGQRRARMPQPAQALAVSQHPGARLAGRRLQAP